MSGEDCRGVSWTVRVHPDEADVLAELVDVCREACATHFPSTDGYVTSFRALSGAIEGATLGMTRGDFKTLVSVQRYARCDCVDTMEIRLVARRVASDPAPTQIAVGEQERTLAGWGIAGCTAGMVGIGAIGLGVTGLLTVWAQMLLLIPALAAWRVCMALRDAEEHRRHARLYADPTVAKVQQRARTDDVDRWHRLVEQLVAQRDAVAERAHLRPFRSPGAAQGSVGVRANRPQLGPTRAVLPLPHLTT